MFKPSQGKRCRVTLIAGLQCLDGILLASDREESGGDRKGSVPKIFEFHNSDCVLAVAGAGHGPLCDLTIERMRRAANKEADKFVEDHERVLKDVLLEVHSEYIWNSASSDDRRIAFIIAVQDLIKKEQLLYLTCEEILQPRVDYACSGTGEIIGGYFLERLYQPDLLIAESEHLLGFILKEAKDSVGGVGRENGIRSTG